MCARFTSPFSLSGTATFFDAESDPVLPEFQGDRFPTKEAPIVMLGERRSLRASHWGLLPKGAKDLSFYKTYSTFNAKSETLADSRLYKKPWINGQRCVIPVTAFTEWRGPKGKKERLIIRDPDTEILSIAGLWDVTSTEADAIHSFTMLTTSPNEFMASFHHRMPVILGSTETDEWLNPDSSADDVSALMKPFEGRLEFTVA